LTSLSATANKDRIEYLSLLNILANARLVSIDNAPAASWQLGHPAFNAWPVLQRWKDEAQAAREALYRLQSQADVWQKSGRAETELLSAEELGAIELSILDSAQHNLTSLEVELLKASREHHEARKQAASAGQPIQLRWPVDSPVVIQRFGENPDAYQAYGLPGHDGIDFEAAAGANVYACADGQVSQADEPASPRQAASKMAPTKKANPRRQPDPRFGIQVRIEHEQADGSVYETSYAHLSEALVAAGDAVQAGQLIGRAGSSGNTSGPHLHLALKIEGASPEGYPPGFVDPWPYLEAPPKQEKLPVVAITRLNLRAQPDTSAAVITRIPQGRRVTVLCSDLADAQAKLGQSGAWLQVELPDGVQGWAAAQYLSLPRQYGFRFMNFFRAEGQSAINLPVFGNVEIANLVYGLSGGMVYAVLDYHEAGMPLPEYEDGKSLPAALYQYLQKRQMDSLANASMLKLAQWTLLKDPEVQKRTRRSELPRLRKMLDSGQLAAVMLVRSRDVTSFSQNQVVLVTGIEQDQGDTFSMLAYDPNYPGQEVRLEIPAEGSWQEWLPNGSTTLPFRGLFILPYKPHNPPDLEQSAYSSAA
jgi:murein DD-endopeptidase MepM/ murein hydrolase activator NlpD